MGPGDEPVYIPHSALVLRFRIFVIHSLQFAEDAADKNLGFDFQQNPVGIIRQPCVGAAEFSVGLELPVFDPIRADPRFTKTYEDIAPGLTRYVHDAILANADRHE